MAVGTKKTCYSSLDKISRLPTTVSQDILARLPLQEAVRTSILSKGWRYAWTGIPHLVFDKSFCKKRSRRYKSRLMFTIAHVLFRHHGSIDRFTFSLSGLLSTDIDQIVHFVTNQSVKDFHLDNRKGENYLLTPPFYSSVDLKNLYLSSCIFRPPPEFIGFGSLKSLKFYRVKVHGDVCSSLISSSPLLEILYLDELSCSGHLNFVAPSLKLFHLKGFFLSVVFKGTHHLETLSMYVDKSWYEEEEEEEEEEDSPEGMFVPLDSLHDVKHMELNNRFVEHMVVDAGSDFIHLKSLKLNNILIGQLNVARNILCLLRSSPNLEKLTVVFYLPPPNQFTCECAVEILDTEDISDLFLYQLREVEIVNISGKTSELMFVEVLLHKSPVLEKMAIKPHLMVRNDSWIRREITGFKRTSPVAQIICRGPYEDEAEKMSYMTSADQLSYKLDRALGGQ